jgi:hypothetical protein
MRKDRLFWLGLINISGLAFIVMSLQSLAAQSPPPSLTRTAASSNCNVLHDLVPSKPNDPTSSDPNRLTPVDGTTKDLILKSGLPCDAINTGAGPAKTQVENRQRGFDFYSWLTFIALNSPATDPDRKGIEGGRADTPTVWEDGRNFIQLLDVMLPGGATPTWGQRVIPQACLGLHALHPDRMVVKMIEESYNQPFKTGPLVDQRNNYAIFDILMNKSMFDYIVTHNLYSRKGQSAQENSNLRIDFPPGRPDKNDPGSIMIKVSWKILEPEDDKSKFHHVEALVAMPTTDDEQSDPPCLEKTLGLVGFHVVHKTINRPQWIWTSFEHVDNVPEQKDIDTHTLKSSYNFYDRSCTADCPINETPPRPWDPEPGNKLKFRLRADGKVLFNSQIVRTIPLSDATRRINDKFQAILSDTVWKNYMLIGTQWPSAFPCTADQSLLKDAPDPFTDFDKQPDMNCAPAPTFLANSTLETFSQGNIPQASSSCMACHGNSTSYLRRQRDVKSPNSPKAAKDAGDVKTMFMSQSDFTFMLEKAR